MSDLVNIDRTCTGCHGHHVLIVPAEQFAAWHGGALVQDAFPGLSIAERDLLISGICPECMPREPDELAALTVVADLTDPAATLLMNLGDAVSDTDATPATEHPACSPDANPGTAGVTPAQLVERAALGLTLEGEPATRGHLSVSDPHWPRCSTELPGIESPLFYTQPNICNRPATLLMAFTPEYVATMLTHTCGDPECPIRASGADPDVLAQLQRAHIPICGMHLHVMRATERQFIRDVGRRAGIKHVFEAGVIGIETASMANGHPEASVIDLRELTGIGR